MRRFETVAPQAQPSLESRPKGARVATLLELARENPDFARACCAGLSPAARQDFIAAMMANRPTLRPLRKAAPQRPGRTEFSIQLGHYSKLVGG